MSDSLWRQAPLSMGLSRQEYWSGLPYPSPEDLPHPGIEPSFPALAGGFISCLTNQYTCRQHSMPEWWVPTFLPTPTFPEPCISADLSSESQQRRASQKEAVFALSAFWMFKRPAVFFFLIWPYPLAIVIFYTVAGTLALLGLGSYFD